MNPDATISRFLYNSRHFNANTAKVKPAAYKPSNKTPSLLSTANTWGLSSLDKWNLGDSIRNMPTLATGEHTPDQIVSISWTDDNNSDQFLSVIPDGEGFPEHCTILNIPLENGKRNIIAQKLAKKATLFIRL